MTAPTPAQIEAAFKALKEIADMRYDNTSASTIAYRALTAAAEVGGNIIERLPAGWVQSIADVEAATIERCAQVADEYLGCREIGRRIRALKDKP